MSISPFDVFAACHVATPKSPERNQDRAELAEWTSQGSLGPTGAAVVVCDGVGSLRCSGKVADAAASAGAAHVREHGLRAGLLGDGATSVTKAAADAVKGLEDGATTVIAVGAESDGFAAYAFAGNGTLLDIEGVDLGEHGVRLSVAELVQPHVSWAKGRPALRSVLPVPGRAEPVAARGLLYPQPDRTRLLLAVTDGVASDEERPIGCDTEGVEWRQSPVPLTRLLAALRDAWRVLAERDALQQALAVGLEALVAEGRLADDATAGAILVVPVRAERIGS